jgi:hypothetical protein
MQPDETIETELVAVAYENGKATRIHRDGKVDH